MVRYQLIDKKMIVSRTATLTYRAAAIFRPGVLFRLDDVSDIRCPAGHRACLAFLGALSYATTMTGMEVFLIGFDNSHPLKQIFWFCMLIIRFFGLALYWFVVYSNSDAVKNTDNPPKSSAVSG
jgi:hypothetical protein